MNSKDFNCSVDRGRLWRLQCDFKVNPSSKGSNVCSICLARRMVSASEIRLSPQSLQSFSLSLVPIPGCLLLGWRKCMYALAVFLRSTVLAPSFLPASWLFSLGSKEKVPPPLPQLSWAAASVSDLEDHWYAQELVLFFFSSPQALSLAPIKCFQSPRKLCLLFCSNLKAKQILEVHHSYLSPVLMCPQYIVYCVCVHNTLLSLCFPKMGLKLQLS